MMGPVTYEMVEQMAGAKSPAVKPLPAMPVRAKLIVSLVLASHEVLMSDFYGKSKELYLVAARREAARRLIAAGYSVKRIGEILQKDHTSVRNYMPKPAAAKRERRASRAVMRWMTPEARETVVAFALAENVTPEVLMAQWIGERAMEEAKEKAMVS